MAEVLVLVDSVDGSVKKPTLELLTAARALGEPAAVVIGAPGTAAPLKATLAEYGAAKIYVAESDDIAGYSVAPKAEALAAVAEQASPAAILVSSSAENKEIVLKFPNTTFEFSGADYVGKFVLPNVYFHITTAYGILRNRGVALGKPDYLGGTQT